MIYATHARIQLFIRRYGHKTPTFYLTAQFRRLNRYFAHPYTSKMYILMKTTEIDVVTAVTLHKLQEVTKRCEAYQRIHNVLSPSEIL